MMVEYYHFSTTTGQWRIWHMLRSVCTKQAKELTCPAHGLSQTPALQEMVSMVLHGC